MFRHTAGTVRPMEFAGPWYPARADACERAIREWWATPLPEGLDDVRFGVVPHAGWVYSGRLAGRVFQALRALPAPALVIVLGGHLRPDDPVVAMVEGEWETPFGPLPIHGGFRTDLERLAAEGVRLRLETTARYAADNSTELQLPFARYKYPTAELLPMRVPPGPAALRVGRALADYLERSGIDAVGVASTDLTHYGPAYGFEPHGRGAEALRWVREENDPAFIEAVAGGDGQRMLAVANGQHNACSSGAVAALNEVAQSLGQRFTPLDYATSDDVKPGDSVNFVGYVGGVFR